MTGRLCFASQQGSGRDVAAGRTLPAACVRFGHLPIRRARSAGSNRVAAQGQA